MAVKIDKKIKGYAVITPEDKAREQAPAQAADRPAEAKDNVIQMHERIERPEVLVGCTYKIKSPLMEHAMYVTINDIVLNQRRLDLVGAADQHVGALDALVHLDHVGGRELGLGLLAGHRGGRGGLLLVLGGDDGVTGAFLLDLDGHDVFLGLAGDEVPG